MTLWDEDNETPETEQEPQEDTHSDDWNDDEEGAGNESDNGKK